MKRGFVQGAFGVFALILIGVLLGSSVTMIYTSTRLQKLEQRSQLDARTWLMNTLRERLELSDDQTKAITKIYDDGEVARTLGAIKARPVFGKPRFEFLQDVYKTLSAEQRILFDKFMRLRFEQSRSFGLSDLIVKLDLTFEEVGQFEVVLAKHVTKDLYTYRSVSSMFTVLLGKAMSDLQQFLPEAKMRALTIYHQELMDKKTTGSEFSDYQSDADNK